MEIWQLNTFRVVAEKLHFTRASEELALTQSAVSHQIKSLENELGVKLLNRNKRKVSLTSQGETVLDYANKMLDQIDLMKQEIKENSQVLKGELKVVMVTRSLDNPFPFIRKDFCDVYKEINLTLETVQDTEEVLDQVRKEKADVGITVKNAVNIFNFDGLLTIPYGVFKLNFVVGADHPLAKKKSISLKDLEKDNLILFEQGSWIRIMTDKIFNFYNFKPDNIYETNDGAVIRTMVKNGEGVAMLPDWGIWEEIESGKLVSVTPNNIKVDIPANIVILSGRRSKMVSAFVDFLLNKEIEGFSIYKE